MIDALTVDPELLSPAEKDALIYDLQARFQDVTTVVNGDWRQLQRYFRCSRAVGRFLSLLSDGRPHGHVGIASSVCETSVDDLDWDGSAGPRVNKVYASHARKALKPHGYGIETLWGIGYQAPPDTAAFLREIMNGQRKLEGEG